ncbi:MAG: efflux RND transporter periplasmic adaptor subunit [Reyranellales bacterium]
MKAIRLTVLTLALCIVLPRMLAIADTAKDIEPVATVTVANLEHGSLPNTVTIFGQVRPAAAADHTISALVSVKVQNVAVREGDRITKGTPIITVVPSPETRAAYRLAKDLAQRTEELAKVHLATSTDLAKAKSELAVLEEEGASGPNTITAPFDAIVLKISGGPGTVVGEGEAIIELAQPDGLEVQAGVDPAHALSIKVGDSVSLTPLNAGASVDGKVLARSEVVDSDNGLVPVQISFPSGKLLIGEMVRATITTGESTGFVVPHEAVLVDDDGTTFVVQAVDGEAKKVAIQVLGQSGDKNIIAGDDLDDKAPVVITGNHQLDDGTKLNVANSKSGDSKGDSK